jgi:hypothetical protein
VKKNKLDFSIVKAVCLVFLGWVAASSPVTVYADIVCSGSPNIPTNHYVHSYGMGNPCSGLYYITQAASGSTILACQIPHSAGGSNYPLPDEYFIQDIVNVGDDCTLNQQSSYAYRLIKPSGNGPFTVCSRTTLPDGYVITQRIHNPPNLDCSPAIVIRKPSTSGTTVICDGSPIPSGFVVTAKGTSSNCKIGPTSSPGPTKTIRTPVAGLNVCDGSPVPPGFGFITVSNISACGGPGYQLVLPQNNTILCQPSPVPAGFVKIESRQYTQCANNGFGFKIHQPQDNQIMCGIDGPAAVPAGYVITEKLDTSACSVGIEYKIRRPSTTSAIVACDGSIVPSGFGFSASAQYDQCNHLSGTGLGFTVRVIQPGDSYCQSSGYTIPEGMVITQVIATPQCNNGFANTIAFPNSSGTTEVCAASTVPAGYIISGRGPTSDYPQCGTFGGFTIRQPSNTGQTIACVGSPIPAGFAFVAVGQYSQCGTGAANGFLIELIQGAGPHTVCEGTVIPNGYVIIEYDTYSQCSGNVNDAGFVIRLPSETGQTTVCESSPIPVGFVIVGLGESSNCGLSGTGFTRTIQRPNDPGVTVICPQSSIPAGFVIVRIINSVTACNGASGRVIQSGSGGGGGGGSAVDPQEFVDTEPNMSDDTIPSVNFDCANGSPSTAFISPSADQNPATCGGTVLE